ncbi:hypothetical protein [Streptomyces sp. x-80]|uniref:hypothetical protein n=1 Tax=Streptomyces sp. x-80 TaxID=2789282 RepID=UPI00397EF662
MVEKKLTGPAVTTFVVTFRDGSTQTVEAKDVDFVEHGVLFTGRKHQQSKVFVAFVPYDDLRMVEAQK